jgi:two-component system, OmpR family, sensor histidine kinase CpxA
MKFKFPLYAQIICVFILNLALLLFVRFAFFNNHLNLGWDLIDRPVAERVQTVAFLMFRQLDGLPQEKWDSVLQEYGDFYNVKFCLFDAAGKQIAGAKVDIPNTVLDKIKLAPNSIPPKENANFMISFQSPPSHPASSFKVVEEPQLFAPLDKFLGGPSHPMPPPPRFFFHTKDPDCFWIGAMFPLLPKPGQGGPPFPGHPMPPRLPEILTPPTVPPGGMTPDQIPPKDGPIDGMLSPNSSVRRELFEHPGSPQPENFDHRIDVTGTEGPPVHGPESPISFAFRVPAPGTLLAVTPNIWQTRLVSDFGNLFVGALGVLGLSLLVWWPFVFLITRTLGKLTRATEKIADGNFDIRVGERRSDEIGRLAQAVNIMAGKLKAYVTGQKRFLGDIAHELCSPIARLQIAVEILERTATPEQEASLRDIREEVEQMSALINELLAFSKAGVRETELHAVDLMKILRSACSKSGGESITITTQERLHCLGDEVLLERAFGNIFRNAIRYAGDAGPITVSCTRTGKEITVVVLDCGPGVPPESIELLGQPFYRPEASRTRTSGGAGLGLSIVKTCIEACQGKFTAQNNSPKGLRIEIQLKAEAPATAEQDPAVNSEARNYKQN